VRLRNALRELSRRPELAAEYLARLTPEQWDHLFYDWQAHSRDDQLPPIATAKDQPWHTWLVLGGRASGKTRAGAEWVRAQATETLPIADRRSHRIALVGDTIAQVRSVMIEGLSGLLSIHRPDERPALEAARNQLVWPNGTIAQMFAADNPDSLRGPQFDAAWCDELCKWRRPDVAWDTLQFALRLGALPQVVVTTTPRPIPLLKRIMTTTPPPSAARAPPTTPTTWPPLSWQR
jgi:phage terminase large subunit-like protein